MCNMCTFIMNMLTLIYSTYPMQNFPRIIEFYLQIYVYIKFKVTSKHYGQLGTTIRFLKDMLGKPSRYIYI